MKDMLVLFFLVIGVFFSLMGGVGLLRFPDLYIRLSASSKAATLGVGSLLLAAAVHFGEPSVLGLVLATLVFLALTMPVAAHMIARAAYEARVPLSSKTWVDERQQSLNGELPDARGKTSSPPP